MSRGLRRLILQALATQIKRWASYKVSWNWKKYAINEVYEWLLRNGKILSGLIKRHRRKLAIGLRNPWHKKLSKEAYCWISKVK